MTALRHLCGMGVFLIGLCMSVPPASAIDRLDLTVALKVLPLLTQKISGDATAAIVYDPASAESKTEAGAIKDIIDNGLVTSGGVRLTGMLVNSAEPGKVLGARIAFYTRGLSLPALDAMNKVTTNAGILTITTELDYVKANKCVLGIVSRPSVRIYYSRVAAEEQNVSFSEAFTMLVDQI